MAEAFLEPVGWLATRRGRAGTVEEGVAELVSDHEAQSLTAGRTLGGSLPHLIVHHRVKTVGRRHKHCRVVTFPYRQPAAQNAYHGRLACLP